MEKQEVLNRITAIGSCDDEVQRRELLSQLSEEVAKDYDNLATLTETNATLTSDNEALRSANYKLFCRVGESKDDNHSTENHNENTTETLTYEGLFNEKGELI